MKQLLLFTILYNPAIAQMDPYKADFTAARQYPGYHLIWADEFNTNGKPDTSSWTYEKGFVRNRELQWYTTDNVKIENGVLLIEAKRTLVPNPDYVKGDTANWKTNRSVIQYTSASIKTQSLRQFQFGRFEIRARIDTSIGSWPAIWTLGASGRWPLGGEIDIMEFYRDGGLPIILANAAWGRAINGRPVWNTKKVSLNHFTEQDPDWVKKFHVWRMDWTKDSINLYLDDELLNTQLVHLTINPDGSNPFLKPQYLLLNLAIGSNGGDPQHSKFPIRFEVDYVRVYQ